MTNENTETTHSDIIKLRRVLVRHIDSYIASRQTSPDNERFREIDRHIDSYIAQRQSNNKPTTTTS